MTTSFECIFYDTILKKKVPCLLIPNELYEIKTEFNRKFYCHVSFDESKFLEYAITKEELVKYSDEIVLLNNIYPTTTQIEIDYANYCIPNNIVNNYNNKTHNENELDRFEKIIKMITDVEGEISSDVFYKLAEFISYELLFMYCNRPERLFMLNLIHNQLTEQPDIMVPQMIRMTRRIFNKYNDNDEYSNYKIHNYNKYSEFYNIDFPFLININNLDYNVHYIDI